MKLKIGDHVRVTSRRFRWYGRVGKIIERAERFGELVWIVWFDGIRTGDRFDPSELEPAPVIDRLGSVVEWDDS